MRLLIISPGVPDEFQGGSAVIFYHYAARLKSAGFQITQFLLLQPENHTEQALERYTAKMSHPDQFDVVPFRTHGPIVSGRFSPRLDSFFVSKVREAAREIRADAVLCFDILSAQVAEPMSACKKFVWLGDLNFQTEWYHALYRAQEEPRGAMGLCAAAVRSLFWKRIYRDVLKTADSVFVSSKSSERCLARLGIQAAYRPYPWPNSNEPGQPVDRHPIPSFLFFGNLAGLGSRSALHFMDKALYPRLVRLWGKDKFQVFICGRQDLLPWMHQALRGKPEFKYLGFVEEINRLMASCHGVLVPIDVPVGNRSRIITAMAQKALVIAHRNTALGNPDLIHGVTCYLARHADEFTECMRMAFDRPEGSRAIIAEAYRRYCTRFSPETAAEALVKELNPHLLDEDKELVPFQNSEGIRHAP